MTKYAPLGNYHKLDKDIYTQAAKLSGLKVDWKDSSVGAVLADYGSLWTAEHDLSDFWRHVIELKNKE